MNRTIESCIASRNPGDFRPATVLVVDDEPIIGDLLAWMLSQAGYNVVSAADGEEALAMSRAARRDFFNVLVADVRLPGMSGIALAAELRATRPELKALFVSGLSREEFAVLGVDMSQAAFLAKPFKARQVYAAIRALATRTPARI